MNKMAKYAKYDAFAEAILNFNDFKNGKTEVDTYLELKFKDLTKKVVELDNFKKNKREYSIWSEKFQTVQKMSGIFIKEDKNTTDNNYPDIYAKKLPPYSFIIQANFKLKQPYFSKDDDEFYIIQNPILKEKVFKVPMIRGSGWKGSLASAFKDLINEEANLEKRKKIIDSYLRIFGAGSESIKVLEDYLKGNSKDLVKFKEKLLEFILFELGMKVDKDFIGEIKDKNSYEELQAILQKKISEKLQKDNKNLPIEFQTHKGRAIFYPTYFDRLSLEVINPHDRRKRAGKQPIYYEVVPEGTEGILQIIYIPFDGILKEDKELKKEAEKDLENLLSAVEKVSHKGIGAKTKLGWGTFELIDRKKYYCINGDIEGTRWEKCQS
jgi:CRISPR-associated protein Cmr2